MSIYRGPGGSGDAVNDSSSEAVLTVQARDAALAAQAAAEAAASDAESIAASINPSSIVITGGSINNTTIGATTASTGSFTNLSSTNVTISTLTSGRVIYAGTSGILKDDADFTFDGTDLIVNNGVFKSTSSSSGTGYVGTVGANFRLINLNASSATQILGSGEIDIRTDGGSPIFFTTSNVERMRINSTGSVGIGNSNPAAKLHVSDGHIRIGDAWSYQWGDGSVAINGNAASDFLVMYTTDTERVRIDSSGNIGIGATANASAILDAQSTTKGVRMPNMTTTQKNAISSPAAGLMVFDTTLAKLCVYTGSAWQTITSV